MSNQSSQQLALTDSVHLPRMPCGPSKLESSSLWTMDSRMDQGLSQRRAHGVMTATRLVPRPCNVGRYPQGGACSFFARRADRKEAGRVHSGTAAVCVYVAATLQLDNPLHVHHPSCIFLHADPASAADQEAVAVYSSDLPQLQVACSRPAESGFCRLYTAGSARLCTNTVKTVKTT